MNWKNLFEAFKEASIEKVHSLEKVLPKESLILVGKTLLIIGACFFPTIFAGLLFFFVMLNFWGGLILFFSFPVTGLWIKFIVSVLETYRRLEQ